MLHNIHTIRQEAAKYLESGFSVIPVRFGEKSPAIRWDEYQTRRATPEEIKKWFSSRNKVGIGLVCGQVSNGFVVLDFDGRDFAGISAEFEENFHEIAYKTRRVETGSGRLHLWLRCPDLPEGLTRIEWKIPDLGDAAVELRANGHYVLAPPSIHPSGKPYRFLNDKPILEVPWDKLEEVITWFDERGKRVVGKEERHHERQTPQNEVLSNRDDREEIKRAAEYYLQRALAIAQPGNRNDTGFWLACQLRDLGLDESEAENYMIRYAEGAPHGEHPYTVDEALATLRSAYRRDPREPAIPGVQVVKKWTPSGREVTERNIDPELTERLVSYHLTDAGNAEAFRDLFGHRFRWVKEKGEWFYWDGVRWISDNGKAKNAMLETMRLRAQAAMSLEDDEARQKTVKWALSSENDYRLKAALSIAQIWLTARYTDFDTDPYLLTCTNGVIDLRTGELRPAKPEDMLHKSTNIRYDPICLLYTSPSPRD